jgi:cytochrome c oxidase subunit 2
MQRLAARLRLRTVLRVAIPLLLIVLLGGCLIPPTPETTQAKDIFSLYTIVFVMGAIVFFAVEGMIVWSIIRYRRRDDRLPDQLHGNTLIEIVWTVIPTVIVLALFVISTITLTTIDAKASNPAVTIEVDAFQWQWTFHYLDKDGDPSNDYTVTGTAANPPVMGLPTGQPVKLILHSQDVIHSFYVPHFLIKRDVIPFPNRQDDNTLEFTITSEGTYAGQCAEFCGDLHSKMTFSVLAMKPADYQKWLADAKAGNTPAPSASPGPNQSPAANGTTIDITADQIAFDKKTLEAPAGQPFVIHFVNKDSVRHNVAIYDASGKALFTGEIIGQGTVDYRVPALAAGDYHFQCDVHPTIMFGTLTAK